MTRYLVLYQPTESGYTAWVPDLPGCMTTGATRQEAETNIQEAVDFHVAGLRHESQPLPEPRTEHGYAVVGKDQAVGLRSVTPRGRHQTSS